MLDKSYDKNIEEKIYKLWEDSGFFNPDNLPEQGEPYTLLLPPPNVTGELHMGHALNSLIQDSLIRYHRMKGYRALWIPGTDHAGIATQNVVEKKLKKEGVSRFDLGEEKFIEKVWEWKEEYGNKILTQLKSLGASCDWSRTNFTMDEHYAKAVEEVFKTYKEKGLIYEGERPVNWCRRCQTSLSDLELEHEEKHGHLYFIKYDLEDGGSIEVATTRPETMLGDTAIAVNPKDERYKNLIGKNAIVPLVNRTIPIVEDQLIDPEFGTGAVKVTPAHSLADYEISIRHKLDSVTIINTIGKIMGTDYDGLKIEEAREKIIIDLGDRIVKTEEYDNSIPKCYRCNTTIEITPSKQWFLKMDELAKKAKEVVKNDQIKFYPKNFEKLYFNWLDNIRDWCISRQIWWGHKIPGSDDVMDTWFSSALWPFATLGWPNNTEDLKTHYPSNVLVTARDIINLWVARMIFSGLEFMGDIPFSKIFIHPTVLTKKGERMSKSKGNGINPLDLVNHYGADATRFGLAWQLTGVQDIKFDEQNIVAGKKFANKIWNATRFVLMNIEGEIDYTDYKIESEHQQKILDRLKETLALVEDGFDEFKFGQAMEGVYHFFWNDFCSTYLEESKKDETENNKKVLMYVLVNSLKIIHPFMPHITEEIYQKLPIKDKKLLIIESWPKI